MSENTLTSLEYYECNIFISHVQHKNWENIFTFFKKHIDNKYYNSIDVVGNSALTWSIYNDMHVLTNDLLIKVNSNNLNKISDNGTCVFHCAFLRNHIDYMMTICTHKLFDPSIIITNANKSNTPLTLVCQNPLYNHIAFTIINSNKNFKINHMNEDGNTALILATKNKLNDIVMLLLHSNECDTNIVNKLGHNALYYMKQNNMYDCICKIENRDSYCLHNQIPWNSSKFNYSYCYWKNSIPNTQMISELKELRNHIDNIIAKDDHYLWPEDK